MTKENKNENIKNELNRAARAMEAANLLFEQGLLNDAVSRLYYSLLHTVRALLLTEGLEPKSHEGVLRVFGLHFIKEGIFEVNDSHLFAKLMKYREEADYNPVFIFIKANYVEFKREAEGLSNRITEYIKGKGYL